MKRLEYLKNFPNNTNTTNLSKKSSFSSITTCFFVKARFFPFSHSVGFLKIFLLRKTFHRLRKKHLHAYCKHLSRCTKSLFFFKLKVYTHNALYTSGKNQSKLKRNSVSYQLKFKKIRRSEKNVLINFQSF